MILRLLVTGGEFEKAQDSGSPTPTLVWEEAGLGCSDSSDRAAPLVFPFGKVILSPKAVIFLRPRAGASGVRRCSPRLHL